MWCMELKSSLKNSFILQDQYHACQPPSNKRIQGHDIHLVSSNIWASATEKFKCISPLLYNAHPFDLIKSYNPGL